MTDKPTPEPKPVERWAAQRKGAIIAKVMNRQISMPELPASMASRSTT